MDKGLGGHSPDVEGTPLLGPLPLELQQIKAQEDAAQSAAARRRSEDSKTAGPQQRNILKIRRRSTGEGLLASSYFTGDDSNAAAASTRRSSRAIKRKKFDDEEQSETATNISPGGSGPPPGQTPLTSPLVCQIPVAQAGSGGPPTGGGDNTVALFSVASPGGSVGVGGGGNRSRHSSMCMAESSTPGTNATAVTCSSQQLLADPSLINSSLALPDIRQRKMMRDKRKKKMVGRREAGVKDLGRWKPTDDLALLSAVEQTKDLGSVYRSVKFSCHFTLAEIQDRWYTLLYDPVISQLAGQAVKNLPSEVVKNVLAKTPFSEEEEDCIMNCGIKSTAPTVSLSDFEKLLQSKASVFQPGRTGRALLTHWQYLKHYSLLLDQAVQPLPKFDSGQHILNFHDGEELVVDSELLDPPDDQANMELLCSERSAKTEIRRLEAEINKWQALVEQVSGSAHTEFDNQTLAVLRGRLVRYLMRSREISVGRATKDHVVDVDLTLEGPSSKISRKQAIIKLKDSADFYLANEGTRPVMVNGKPVLTGESVMLHNNTVVEFASLKFTFLINADLIEAIRAEAIKNHLLGNKL